ncbi:hypothetical protein FSP39_001780 [Pinctada imbricata]|uniref:Uncharacterized protein n=1 Tax=Pinctada imbricata TaxID=66713 RepID=A0AA89BTS9_PINIB|nr:hypothetical protein FSP39_001780 [Pinctada imbricata]
MSLTVPGPLDKNVSSSMSNLSIEDEEERSFKDKLKRTFSSLKRRKRRQDKTLLTVPEPSLHTGHRKLSMVQSNPIPYVR